MVFMRTNACVRLTASCVFANISAPLSGYRAGPTQNGSHMRILPHQDESGIRTRAAKNKKAAEAAF
jgi:hypothetical protein